MNFLHANEHTDTVFEISKVLEIVLMTPVVESRQRFTILSRIKKCIRNSVIQERLTALTVLSAHKKHIRHILDFSQKEIAKYASQKITRSLQINKSREQFLHDALNSCGKNRFIWRLSCNKCLTIPYKFQYV
jgi:hypothetical protein